MSKQALEEIQCRLFEVVDEKTNGLSLAQRVTLSAWIAQAFERLNAYEDGAGRLATTAEVVEETPGIKKEWLIPPRVGGLFKCQFF